MFEVCTCHKGQSHYYVMNCLFCLKAERREELQQKDEADRLYHHVKREVENGLAYLQVLHWLPHSSVMHICFSLPLHCKFFLNLCVFEAGKICSRILYFNPLKRYQHFSYVCFGCTLFCLHIKTINLQLCLHERYTLVPKFWHQLLLIWPIMVLQEKRKEDPYREFVPRVLYESISGMKNKAPTFIPEWLILRWFPKTPKLCKHVWQPVAPDSRWILQSNRLFLRHLFMILGDFSNKKLS